MRLFCLHIIFLLVLMPLGSFSQTIQNNFPYHLAVKTEIAIISGGLVLNLSYTTLKNNDYVDQLPEAELFQLNSNDINSIDQISTRYWSPKNSNYSDHLRNTLRYAPALFSIPLIKNKSWNQLITLGLIYAEGYYLTAGITRCTKILIQRKRPYLYNNTTIPEADKIDLSKEDNAYFSFFSGHTSSAFYSASFISKAFYDMYGANRWFYTVTALSYTAASGVGYLRIRSGEHYPTDVMVGALAGSLTAYFITELHKKRNPNLHVFLTHEQFSLVYQF